MRGCLPDNELSSALSSRPLPWVGLYVAAASLICGLCMAADAFRGFRYRRLWFPTKFFPLNATTLALLSVASKFTLDLTTAMPNRADQLSKLSSTVLICTIIGNFMPSLGSMTGSDIATNAAALAIFIVTVVINMSIQMGTRVIYVFLPEHIIVLSFMLALLVLLLSSSLTVSVSKRDLNGKFNEQFRQLRQKTSTGAASGSSHSPSEKWDMYSPERLKELIEKYWLMAHTGSPQFVLGRSATCTASGAFCLLATLILIEASIRSFKQKSLFCKSKSDYKWSTTVVLFVQAVAIIMGTVAPAYRWFNAISFRNLHSFSLRKCKEEFQVEDHWVKMLQELKEAPFQFHIRRRWKRKVAHKFKTVVLSVLIVIQKGVVHLSKFVRLLSMWFPILLHKIKKAIGNVARRGRVNHNPPKVDLEKFVLRLQGEDDLVAIIMKGGRRDTVKWIEKGSRKKPSKLIDLITNKHSNCRGGFQGALEFDNKNIGSLVEEEYEPPNCWALPIVTLATIAVVLKDKNAKSVNFLMQAVDEGLAYIRIIEEDLDTKGLVSMRDAAEIVWLRLFLSNKWLDNNLSTLSCQKDNESILKELQKISKSRVENFWNEERSKDVIRKCLEWPEEVLAANCMYRITSAILIKGIEIQNQATQSTYPSLHSTIVGGNANQANGSSDPNRSQPRTESKLYLWIECTIADILRACLTNLPQVIHDAVITSRIEVREESIRKAALLFGEARGDIIEKLCIDSQAEHVPEKIDFIDEWRKM